MSSTGNNEFGTGKERENFQSWGKRCKKDMVKLARYMEINSPGGETDDQDDMESQRSVEDNGEEMAEDERLGELSIRDEDEGEIAQEGVAGGFHRNNGNVEVAEEDIREGKDIGNEYKAGEDDTGSSSKAGKSKENCSKACLKKVEALENEVKHWKKAFVSIRNRHFILKNTFKEFHGNYAKFSNSIISVLENLGDNEKEGNDRQNTPSLESDRSSDMIDVFLRSMNETVSMRSSSTASMTSLQNENQYKALPKKRGVSSPQPGPSSYPHPFSPTIPRSSPRRGLASSPALSAASSSSSMVVLPPSPKEASDLQTEVFPFIAPLTHDQPRYNSGTKAPQIRRSSNSFLNSQLSSQPAQALTLSRPQDSLYDGPVQPIQPLCSSQHFGSCAHGNDDPMTFTDWDNNGNGYLQDQDPTSFSTRRVRFSTLEPTIHYGHLYNYRGNSSNGAVSIAQNTNNDAPDTNYGRYYYYSIATTKTPNQNEYGTRYREQ